MIFLSKLRQRRQKFQHELAYWKGRHHAERELKHTHYEQFYTTVFGLTHDFYAGKKLLDIGCGPRGSLEWADMAAERVGPLADDYKKLGANRHKMSYVNASSDHIPFTDGYFDVVTTFNSLDHVDSLDRSIAEIGRVAKQQSTLLLMVEINHPPTPTEPITLTRAILDRFRPAFSIKKTWECSMLERRHDVYGGVLWNQPPARSEDAAILCAMLRHD